MRSRFALLRALPLIFAALALALALEPRLRPQGAPRGFTVAAVRSWPIPCSDPLHESRRGKPGWRESVGEIDAPEDRPPTEEQMAGHYCFACRPPPPPPPAPDMTQPDMME